MVFFAAFCIALLISLIFSVGILKETSFGSVLLFFLVLYMAVLAGNFWIVPFGPLLWGVAWFPLLSVGIICAFLFMVPPPTRVSSKRAQAAATGGMVAVDFLMWTLFIMLLLAVIVGFSKDNDHYKVVQKSNKVELNNMK